VASDKVVLRPTPWAATGGGRQRVRGRLRGPSAEGPL